MLSMTSTMTCRLVREQGTIVASSGDGGANKDVEARLLSLHGPQMMPEFRYVQHRIILGAKY